MIWALRLFAIYVFTSSVVATLERWDYATGPADAEGMGVFVAFMIPIVAGLGMMFARAPRRLLPRGEMTPSAALLTGITIVGLWMTISGASSTAASLPTIFPRQAEVQPFEIPTIYGDDVQIPTAFPDFPSELVTELPAERVSAQGAIAQGFRRRGPVTAFDVVGFLGAFVELLVGVALIGKRAAIAARLGFAR